jgi:transcriptional repressor NrdR
VRCPFCRSLDNHVVDSRATEDGGAIRRRRQCHGCTKRFTSYERVEEALPMVVKRDGRREAYDRLKLIRGLARACEKRPVSMPAIEAAVDGVERRLMEDGDREVRSVRLGECVMDALKALDKVAYIRFASVYRQFADLTDFTEEVQRLKAQDPGQPEQDAPVPAQRRVDA